MAEPLRALRLLDTPPGPFPDGYGENVLCYWQYAPGHWYLNLPGGFLADLSNHEVAEYEDGTITAAPSVLVGNAGYQRHGFLERGMWREC